MPIFSVKRRKAGTDVILATKTLLVVRYSAMYGTIHVLMPGARIWGKRVNPLEIGERYSEDRL